jgi:hypothetical protein
MGFFPCWRTGAGEDVGSWVWAPAGLGADREPASWSCCSCFPAWGVVVQGLLVGVCLPGLGDGLCSLLVYLGWVQFGIRDVGSSRVGVGEVSGVLVLQSL